MDIENPMRNIRVEKVTFNLGVGESGQKLENAKELLSKLTGKKPATTTAKVRSPTWKIKKGDPIGAKVTIRGAAGEDLLKRALQANEKKIKASSFDRSGNVSFGVREYIDFPGAKYDPKIGMLGFDVCVTLGRRGRRIRERRRRMSKKLGMAHRVTSKEAQEFMVKSFGIELVE